MKTREEMQKKIDDLTDMLHSVVDELQLSDEIIAEHGPLGTPVHELVRLVLESKDRAIRNFLRCKEASPA